MPLVSGAEGWEELAGARGHPWTASAEHWGEEKVGDRGQMTLIWKGGQGHRIWGGLGPGSPGAMRGSHGWGDSGEVAVTLAPRKVGQKGVS